MAGLDRSLADLARHLSRRRLFSYQPYPKQYEFHRLCGYVPQVALIAGNQVGKTYCGGYQLAFHATGLYPDWWPGRRYQQPGHLWAASISNERQRDVTQKVLFGTTLADPKSENFGTGAIPKDWIKEVSVRQAGIKNVIDQVVIKWRDSKQTSTLSLKTYEQGRLAFQGEQVRVIWADEEPAGSEAIGIFTEMETRQQTIEDSCLFMTFTPLLGNTQIVQDFLSSESLARQSVAMSIYDAVGGIWPEGTPWAGEEWVGHYTKEQADAEVALKKPHERNTRIYGIPMMGEGAVFPIDEESLKFDMRDFPGGFPMYFAHIIGLDFGIGHPCGIVWAAYDRESDIMYVYDAFRSADLTPEMQATVIRSRPNSEWIPVAWPHDGHQRDKGTGNQMWRVYYKQGLKMMTESARFDDDLGGPQSTEHSNERLLDRMMDGRLKIARHLHPLFEEIRMYHRKADVLGQPKVVPVKDDLIRAMGYAEMELRHARTQTLFKARKHKYTRPVVGGRL